MGASTSRTEHEKARTLRLARAFLHESAEMLLRPLRGWLGVPRRERERYVDRSSSAVTREQDRQDSESDQRPTEGSEHRRSPG